MSAGGAPRRARGRREVGSGANDLRVAGSRVGGGCRSGAKGQTVRGGLHKPLQFVAKFSIAFLRGVEIREPDGRIGRRRRRRERLAGIGHAPRTREQRRHARWQNARSARLFGVGHNSGRDRGLRLGELIRLRIWLQLGGKREGREIEAVFRRPPQL